MILLAGLPGQVQVCPFRITSPMLIADLVQVLVIDSFAMNRCLMNPRKFHSRIARTVLDIVVFRETYPPQPDRPLIPSTHQPYGLLSSPLKLR